MAEKAKKRPLPEDDFDAPPPPPPLEQRRARFPKGKKARRGGGDLPLDGDAGEHIDNLMDPQLASKERAKRRNQMREDELFGDRVDVSSAEVQYEDNANFEDDGIRIEPFNLKQEREEGYFDANGNFVEYAKQNEIKDAWLDSVEVDTKFAEKFRTKLTAKEVYEDLSSDEIGKIKRRIASALKPGETIIQALKRLKGTSNDKKAKMSDVMKQIFDQLTEDAMKLMENGEYNVYYEERETFEREAEGYERVARARADTTSSTKSIISESAHGEDIFTDGKRDDKQGSAIWDLDPGPSAVNVPVQQASPSDGGDKFDIFGDDDDDTANENLPVPTAVGSASAFQQVNQPTSGSLDSYQDLDSGDVGHGGVGNDYVYDQSSGYYYSSSMGYYYDPASGMYCCGTTGTWYKFDEQSGTYVVGIQSDATTES